MEESYPLRVPDFRRLRMEDVGEEEDPQFLGLWGLFAWRIYNPRGKLVGRSDFDYRTLEAALMDAEEALWDIGRWSDFEIRIFASYPDGRIVEVYRNRY